MRKYIYKFPQNAGCTHFDRQGIFVSKRVKSGDFFIDLLFFTGKSYAK